jgi:hypothetical protein
MDPVQWSLTKWAPSITASNNNRVMRWLKDSKSGSVIIGGRGSGSGINLLSDPNDLTFDRQGNLYVSDWDNDRVQMYTIDKSSCAKGTCQKSAINRCLSLSSLYSIGLERRSSLLN